MSHKGPGIQVGSIINFKKHSGYGADEIARSLAGELESGELYAVDKRTGERVSLVENPEARGDFLDELIDSHPDVARRLVPRMRRIMAEREE